MAVPVQHEARPQARKASATLQYPSTFDFVFLVSPNEIDMINGEPLPRLKRFPIEPGCCGVPSVKNADDPPQWDGAVANECRITGRMLVDPARYGIKPKLNGVEVEPADDEDPNDPRCWYVRRYRGHKGWIHVSLWQQPRTLGTRVLWTTDHDGEIDFRRQIIAKMFAGGEVDPQVAETVKIEVEQEVAALEAAAKHDPRMVRNAEVAKAALGTRTEGKRAPKP